MELCGLYILSVRAICHEPEKDSNLLNLAHNKYNNSHKINQVAFLMDNSPLIK